MRDGRTRVWTAAALLLLAHATSALGAGWAPDGAPVCDVAANQYDPRVADGGVNGVYAAWADYRNGIADIYAARLDPWGVRAWGPLGAAVCTAANAQGYPALASDGAGGVIIAWHDARSGVDNDIYAQRLDAAGNPQWAADGVLVCGATGQQRYVEVLADGAGGVIVVWEDGRGGVDDDLYAQRLDATGNALWTADGVALCTAAGNQLNTALLADGAGGAFFAWLDSRGGADIYAQHVDATGSALWVANGAGVCTAASAQYTPDLVSDGAGGVIIAWEDARAGN
ncbi:MAG: hypothetical protein OEO21_13060, partial [Candidatus Krumholzibacteria bacterium]|nr:hypothetical protein [Candidatus Krumholzibacteria bacterium]